MFNKQRSSEAVQWRRRTAPDPMGWTQKRKWRIYILARYSLRDWLFAVCDQSITSSFWQQVSSSQLQPLLLSSSCLYQPQWSVFLSAGARHTHQFPTMCLLICWPWHLWPSLWVMYYQQNGSCKQFYNIVESPSCTVAYGQFLPRCSSSASKTQLTCSLLFQRMDIN